MPDHPAPYPTSISVARTFPRAEVLGFDADEASVNDARASAAAHGVPVRFEVSDAVALAGHGPFDVFFVLEDVLRSLCRALTPGGSVIIADEKVDEPFMRQPMTLNG